MMKVNLLHSVSFTAIANYPSAVSGGNVELNVVWIVIVLDHRIDATNKYATVDLIGVNLIKNVCLLVNSATLFNPFVLIRLI